MSRFLHFRFLALFVLLITLWGAFHFFSQSDSPQNIEGDPLSDGEPRLLAEVNRGASKKPITLTVFFEALCSDSSAFFINQLLPTVQRMPQYIHVDLVPYGKASTHKLGPNNFSFECQHGPEECLGNKMMSCALQHAESDTLKTRLISCMFDSFSMLQVGEKCCRKFSIPWSPVETCLNGPQGSILLNEYGIRTKSLQPPVKFIPTVLINNQTKNQRKILKDLKLEVCKELETMGHSPEVCQQ